MKRDFTLKQHHSLAQMGRICERMQTRAIKNKPIDGWMRRLFLHAKNFRKETDEFIEHEANRRVSRALRNFQDNDDRQMQLMAHLIGRAAERFGVTKDDFSAEMERQVATFGKELPFSRRYLLTKGFLHRERSSNLLPVLQPETPRATPGA